MSKMDKSLTNALCTSGGMVSLVCQAFFWTELIFYKRITDGALKFLFYSGGLLVLIFLVLIVHNIIRFIFYLHNWERRQGRTHA